MAMRHNSLPQRSAACFRSFGNLAFKSMLLLSLSGCATPGVTKGTGRVMDPPIELILYCLLAPADPACRAILK